MSVEGKVVLITGSSSPVGIRLAELFVEAGALTALSVRRSRDVETLQRRFFDRLTHPLILRCDLQQEDEIVRAVHRVVDRYGRIDVVINAVSITGPKLPVINYPVDPWRNVLATNLTGAYLVCREALPWMERQGGGSIINVTSAWGSQIKPQGGAFIISTQALEGLTQLLAAEHRGTGVRINSVEIPGGLTGDAAEDAQWTLPFLWLASDEAGSVTGRKIQAMGFKQPASTTPVN